MSEVLGCLIKSLDSDYAPDAPSVAGRHRYCSGRDGLARRARTDAWEGGSLLLSGAPPLTPAPAAPPGIALAIAAVPGQQHGSTASCWPKTYSSAANRRNSGAAVSGNKRTPARSVLDIQLQESVAETVLLTALLKLDWQH